MLMKSFLKKMRNYIYIKYLFFCYRKYIIVWIYPHIGDMFYGLPYIKEHKNNSKKKYALIGNLKYFDMYSLFGGIDKYVLISNKKVFRFSASNNFSFVRKYMIKKIKKGNFISNDFKLVSNIYPIDKEITLQEYTKFFIYNLPKTFIPCYPKLSFSTKITSNKYVILCPYAQTVEPIDMKFYEYLANKLKEKGYEVYTNVGKNETAIKDTIELNVSLLELCDYAEHSSAVIALRSGVCDMIAALTNAKLFVFFNGYFLGKFASLCDYRENGNEIFEFYDLIDKNVIYENIIDDIIQKI